MKIIDSYFAWLSGGVIYGFIAFCLILSTIIVESEIVFEIGVIFGTGFIISMAVSSYMEGRHIEIELKNGRVVGAKEK